MASSPLLRPMSVAVLLGAALLLACGGDRSAEGPARGDETDGRGRDAGSESDADRFTPDDVVTIDLGGADGGSDAAAGPDAPIPGRGGLVSADPSSIYMTFSGAGVVLDQLIRVYNNGEDPVVITSVELVDPDPGFVVFDDPVDYEMAPGASIGFTLRFESGEEPEARADIEIHTSLGTSVIIPVAATEKAGSVDDPPCVDVRPRRVDFGRVERGSAAPAPRTVTISNCGEAEIMVSRFDRASIFFIPTPASFQWTYDRVPISLAAGETTELEITYSPGRVGIERGGIDVRTNVEGSETVRVDLAAETVLPPISELDVHLLLRWDVTGGSDVDFHFLRDGAELFSCDDCYFSNMTPDWGVPGDTIDDPFLDIDDLEGPGPENINVDELEDGSYRIVVHYYSDTGSGGGGGSGFGVAANATVEVYLGGALAATYGPTHLSTTGKTWDVARLDWPSGTLTELGRVYDLGSHGSCFGGL